MLKSITNICLMNYFLNICTLFFIMYFILIIGKKTQEGIFLSNSFMNYGILSVSGVIEYTEEEKETKKTIFGFNKSRKNNKDDSDSDEDDDNDWN